LNLKPSSQPLFEITFALRPRVIGNTLLDKIDCRELRSSLSTYAVIMAAHIPDKLKSADLTRFIVRAAQLEKVKPVMAYWCM